MKDLLENKTEFCVDVALPLPIAGPFSYSASAGMEEQVTVGVRVLVPFRNREMVAYVVSFGRRESDFKLKPVLQVLDREPVISENMLRLTKWVSERWGSSWGEAIESALPKWVKYGKKAERALNKISDAEPGIYQSKPDFSLSPDQTKAMEAIHRAFESKTPNPILLCGVTGSGKSEIYIRAIREALLRKKAVICLVPEIALTEQLKYFFLNHFGDRLEVLHSKQNDTERFLAWKRLENSEKTVILGPRSAVFAPVPDLGLILMDEEHEGSYKQETVPRYHAREVAEWRARNEGAVFVMGSATPSLESMYRSEKGSILRVDLTTRIDSKPMPKVTVLDLREETQNRKKRSILSTRLASEIEINLERKEGTLLLLNRRGFSTYIHCPQCSAVENCVSCQISLTHHLEDDTLLCHYCNYRKPIPDTCSQCGGSMLRFSGFGTEKVESDVAARWPAARIARMDTDSIRKKGTHEAMIRDFRDQKIDILIGTQMIAKGFDFPHVTLVGVVLADVGLMLPDFRSSERTFQLLTQVAGRAGRGKVPGRVFVQTYSPDHASVKFAKDHDFMSFYQHEIVSREELKYPPYSSLINFIIRSRDEKKAYLQARAWRDLLKSELEMDKNAVPPEIIGPSPLPFYKLRGHFRWHVMVKSPEGAAMVEKITALLPKLKKSSAVAMAIDVDPVNIL